MTKPDLTTAPVVAQLVQLLDEAFAGDALAGEDWHSLLGNLRTVPSEAWDWLPAVGSRSIRDIVQHVGGCKFMYENHAFGDGSLRWDHPLVMGEGVLSEPSTAMAWLREGHDRLRHSIAALTDADLDRPRMTNWGEAAETRWIVTVMIHHDVYHAGEVNHLRSLHSGDDRWAHERRG